MTQFRLSSVIVLESDFCGMKGSCVKFCPDDNLRNNAGFFELPDLSNGLDIVLPFIDIKEFLYQGVCTGHTKIVATYTTSYNNIPQKYIFFANGSAGFRLASNKGSFKTLHLKADGLIFSSHINFIN